MTKKINWKEHISSSVNSLPTSGLSKFLDIIATKKNVISLSIGEPDFTSPLCVRKSAIKSIEEGYTSYTSCYGLLDLRKEITKHFEKKYDVSYDPEKEVLITVGVSEALDLVMRALISSGDEVLMPEPCYVANKACIIMAGGVPVPIATKAQEGFFVNITELEKHITQKTKAIIVSYPTNPTGATMNRQQLLEIAKFAEKHNIFVVSDELYADLTYNSEHTCFTSLPGMKERTILLSGFSKTYAMTGLRIGYAMAPVEVINAMLAIHQYTMLCAPITAQYAAIDALKYAQADYEFMYDIYNKRRKIMIDGFKKIGVPTFEPQGAFYIFPDISVTGLNSTVFTEKLLEEQEVAVIPGSAFGECGEGFIRCSYATSNENLFKALDRIDKFINKASSIE